MSAAAVGTGTFTTTVTTPVKYKLEETGVKCVECKIENSGGTAVGSGKLTFTGVKVVEPAGCSVVSEITTKPLTVTADWMSGTKNYIRFVPTAGETTPFVTIEITGCGELNTTLVAKGSLFVETVNATGVQAVEQELLSSEAINSAAGGGLHVGTEVAALNAVAKLKMSGAKVGTAFGTH